MCTLEKFWVVSGAHSNISESLGSWFGAWECATSQFAGIYWVRIPPKYFGAPLDAYRFRTHYRNERSPKLERQAQIYFPHRLSIFGRAEACNMFLATKIYCVTNYARLYIQRFHPLFATFVWSSSFEPMRRDDLFRPVKERTLGLMQLYLQQIASRFLSFFFFVIVHIQ